MFSITLTLFSASPGTWMFAIPGLQLVPPFRESESGTPGSETRRRVLRTDAALRDEGALDRGAAVQHDHLAPGGRRASHRGPLTLRATGPRHFETLNSNK